MKKEIDVKPIKKEVPTSANLSEELLHDSLTQALRAGTINQRIFDSITNIYGMLMPTPQEETVPLSEKLVSNYKIEISTSPGSTTIGVTLEKNSQFKSSAYMIGLQKAILEHLALYTHRGIPENTLLGIAKEAGSKASNPIPSTIYSIKKSLDATDEDQPLISTSRRHQTKFYRLEADVTMKINLSAAKAVQTDAVTSEPETSEQLIEEPTPEIALIEDKILSEDEMLSLITALFMFNKKMKDRSDVEIFLEEHIFAVGDSLPDEAKNKLAKMPPAQTIMHRINILEKIERIMETDQVDELVDQQSNEADKNLLIYLFDRKDSLKLIKELLEEERINSEKKASVLETDREGWVLNYEYKDRFETVLSIPEGEPIDLTAPAIVEPAPYPIAIASEEPIQTPLTEAQLLEIFLEKQAIEEENLTNRIRNLIRDMRRIHNQSLTVIELYTHFSVSSKFITDNTVVRRMLFGRRRVKDISSRTLNLGDAAFAYIASKHQNADERWFEKVRTIAAREFQRMVVKTKQAAKNPETPETTNGYISQRRLDLEKNRPMIRHEVRSILTRLTKGSKRKFSIPDLERSDDFSVKARDIYKARNDRDITPREFQKVKSHPLMDIVDTTIIVWQKENLTSRRDNELKPQHLKDLKIIITQELKALKDDPNYSRADQ